MMSKRDDNWHKLLFDSKSRIRESFAAWLKNNKRTCFQIVSADFKHVGLNPRTMIPTYQKEQVPQPLKTLNLELFRNQAGGCVITKTGNNRSTPTLFPSFPQCQTIEKPPFKPIPYSSLLFRREVFNEVTAFFLAQRMGVLLHFLNLETSLDHCGRLQGTVSGATKIGNERVEIQKALFEIDHVLENDEMIVLVEMKAAFQNTMSIHQLFLPYLYLLSLGEERTILPVYFMTNDPIPERGLCRFRLYLLEFQHDEVDNVPIATAWRFRKSAEYRIIMST